MKSASSSSAADGERKGMGENASSQFYSEPDSSKKCFLKWEFFFARVSLDGLFSRGELSFFQNFPRCFLGKLFLAGAKIQKPFFHPATDLAAWLRAMP